jgi:circadian clock protein KaiB
MEVQKHRSPEVMVLRLYVAGDTLKSRLTIANLKDICQKNLKGKCNVEIIDLNNHPDIAVDKNISAIPTLIKELPQPVRTIIGDLASKEKVLVALDIEHFKEEMKPHAKIKSAEDLKTVNEKLMEEVARLKAENDNLRRMLRKSDL